MICYIHDVYFQIAEGDTIYFQLLSESLEPDHYKLENSDSPLDIFVPEDEKLFILLGDRFEATVQSVTPISLGWREVKFVPCGMEEDADEVQSAAQKPGLSEQDDATHIDGQGADKVVSLPRSTGTPRVTETGVNRDANEDKGRCDLLPMKEVAMVLFLHASEKPVSYEEAPAVFTKAVAEFMEDQNVEHLALAIRACHAGIDAYRNLPIEHMFLDVSKLYQGGAAKYGENNWRLGMPVKWCIDSGCRHFFKARAVDWAKRSNQKSEYDDEPHHRGPVWNLLCAMWLATNKPETLNDLVVIERRDNRE